MLDDLRTLGHWAPRRWLVAAATAAAFVLAVAVPTDLIDTSWFRRDVPPTWWAWPSLLLSGALVGMLAGSYVADPTPVSRPRRFGVVGSLLTFFAVGCPVCNKLVLLALGYTGALTWFEPLQPVLQALAIGLLGWALLARLRGARACPVSPSDDSTTTTSASTTPVQEKQP